MASDTSRAVTKRRSPDSSALIIAPSSQPPVKRIKRPAEVLEEEDYEAGLAHIIRRDFFPGLAETEAKREYLAALESGDPDWISEAGQLLHAVSQPGKEGQRARAKADIESTPILRLRGSAGDTPRGWKGDTPGPRAAETPTGKEGDGGETGKPDDTTSLNTDLSLNAFQHKYTSEDNESFYKLLDKSNEKRVQKVAYMWNGTNKMPSNRQLEESRRSQALITAREHETLVNGRELARLSTEDERPAAPRTWHARPDNNLMFIPDGVDDMLGSEQKRAEGRSRMGEKAIIHENTRMPPPPLLRRQKQEANVPPSPSLSAVRDAVHGRPRLSASEIGSQVTGSETPRVNGWAFVDSEEPEPEPEQDPARSRQRRRRKGRNHGSDEDDDDDISGDDSDDSEENRERKKTYEIDLGPGDAAPNPFSIRPEGARDALHGRMLDRMNKRKAQSKLDSLKQSTPIPKFTSSPRVVREAMSPAARRLLGSVGSGRETPLSKSKMQTQMQIGETWNPASSTPRTRDRAKAKAKTMLTGVTPVRKGSEKQGAS